MKTCVACHEEKALTEFSWRYKGTPKQYQEVRCKKCRGAVMNRANMLKREEAVYENEPEETPMPCDSCFKADNCEKECASFKCWSEHGV